MEMKISLRIPSSLHEAVSFRLSLCSIWCHWCREKLLMFWKERTSRITYPSFKPNSMRWEFIINHTIRSWWTTKVAVYFRLTSGHECSYISHWVQIFFCQRRFRKEARGFRSWNQWDTFVFLNKAVLQTVARISRVEHLYQPCVCHSIIPWNIECLRFCRVQDRKNENIKAKAIDERIVSSRTGFRWQMWIYLIKKKYEKVYWPLFLYSLSLLNRCM